MDRWIIGSDRLGPGGLGVPFFGHLSTPRFLCLPKKWGGEVGVFRWSWIFLGGD